LFSKTDLLVLENLSLEIGMLFNYKKFGDNNRIS
jgi:hypothetical protein